MVKLDQKSPVKEPVDHKKIYNSDQPSIIELNKKLKSDNGEFSAIIGKFVTIDKKVKLEDTTFSPEYFKQKYFKENEINEFLHDSEEHNWADDNKGATIKRERSRIFEFFSKFDQLSHTEMIITSDGKGIKDYVIKILSCGSSDSNMRKLILKDKHDNWTLNENARNRFLTLQGHMIKTLTYSFQLNDFKFVDKIDSQNVEYNHPFARDRIRQKNRQSEAGTFWIKKYDIQNFCEQLLINHFPQVNGIWLDADHDVHVQALIFIKYVLELGLIENNTDFYGRKWSTKFLGLLESATTSLKRLEECWNDQWQKKVTMEFQDRSIELERGSPVYRLNKKFIKVAKCICQCKENLAHIITQQLIQHYDTTFIDIYPMFVYKGASFITEDAEMEYMIDRVTDEFPLSIKGLNNSVLNILMRYCLSTKKLGFNETISDESRITTEKAFMFVTTKDRDCFITSLRCVTQSDYKFFEIHLESETQSHKYAKIIKDSILAVIHDMAQGIENGMIKESATANIRKNLDNIDVKASDEEMDQEKKKLKSSVRFIETSPNNSNQREQIILICKKVSRQINKYEDIKYILCRHSIPVLLLGLMDYLTEMTGSEFYGSILSGIVQVLFQTAKFNNLAKAQIFKGIGAEHLFRLLERKVSLMLILCIRLTSQVNIGAFISKEIYKQFVKVYESLLKDAIEWYNPKKIKNNTQNYSEFDMNLHTNLFLISRFFEKLFEKRFINERQRIANMFQIQQLLFKIIAEYMIPTTILISEDQDMQKQSEGHLVEKKYYASSNEEEFFFLTKEKQFDVPMIKQLIATICIGNIRVFNRVVVTAFSYKVLEKMMEPCKMIVNHLEHIHWMTKEELKQEAKNHGLHIEFSDTWILNTYHNPEGKNAALLRIIEKFKFMPESNVLIDRKNVFTNRPECCSNKDELVGLVQMLVHKIHEFKKETQDLGIFYILDGVFPMIYKFVKGLRTGTNYRDYQDIKCSIEAITSIIEELQDIQDQLKKLFTTQNAAVNIDFSSIAKDVDNLSQSMLSIKTFDKAKSSMELQENCSKILVEITKIYEIQPLFMKTLSNFKDSSKLQYCVDKKSTRFFENKPMDEDQKKKQRVLNKIQKVYKNAKGQYLNGKSDINLINFFTNNTDNLKGIYESVIDILYYNAKKGNCCEGSYFNEEIALNPMVNKFWCNPSIQFYIKMISKQFLAGDCTRTNFFKFMNEDKIGNTLTSNTEILESVKTTTPEYIEAKPNPDIDRNVIENKYVDSRRRRLIDFLCKLSCDIMFYLIEKPTINNIWWNLAETYDMIIQFMKNLAEGNHAQYKIWMSGYVPSSLFDKSFNSNSCNSIEVYVSSFCYVINYSMILENKESNIVPTDQAPRIMALLKPNLELLNEMATGPCKENQEIILSVRYLPVWPILSRFIDDISSEWYEMQTIILNFVRSLQEDAAEHIIKRVANRFPVSNIEDLIFRLTKKMYIREKILDKSMIKCISSTIRMPVGQEITPEDYTNNRTHKMIKDLKLKCQYPNTIDKSLKIWGQVDILKDNLTEKTDEERNMEKLKAHEQSILEMIKAQGLTKNEEIEYCFNKFCDHMDHHRKHSAKIYPAVNNVEDCLFSDLLITRKRMSKVTDIIRTLQARNFAEDDIDFNFITSEAENLNCLEVKHWQDLKKIYLSSARFAGSIEYDHDLNMESQNIFNIIFLVLSIWETLNNESIEHRNRYNELRQQAKDDFDNEVHHKLSVGASKEKSAIVWFYSHITGRIEVVNGVMNILYIFPLRPAYFILSETMKHEYREQCDISDANTKMIELMNRFPVFNESMENDLTLFRKNKFLYFFAREDSFRPIQTFLYFIACLANLFLFIDLKYKVEDIEVDGAKPGLYSTGTEALIRALSIIMAITAFLGLLMFVGYRFETLLLEKEIIFKKNNPGKDINSPLWSGKIVVYQSFLMVPFVFSMIVHILTYMLYEQNSNAWLIVNLFQIVNISSICKNVLMAVINHWDQLLLTFLMLQFVMFFFTLIIVEYFIHFLPDEISCSHLHKCFWQVINDGLRMGGGIGDVMDPPTLSNDAYFGYMFFQLAFFVIVNIIFLNVIFGIIIDTFSALREASNARVHDIKNVCFICGYTRFDFSKKNIDFDHHTEFEHNPWQYLGFLYHIKEVGETDLNGLENFAWDCYNEKETHWLPIGNTMYMQGEDEQDNWGGINESLDEVIENSGHLEEINENIQHIKTWIQEFDKKGCEIMAENISQNNFDTKLLKKHQDAVQKDRQSPTKSIYQKEAQSPTYNINQKESEIKPLTYNLWKNKNSESHQDISEELGENKNNSKIPDGLCLGFTKVQHPEHLGDSGAFFGTDISPYATPNKQKTNLLKEQKSIDTEEMELKLANLGNSTSRGKNTTGMRNRDDLMMNENKKVEQVEAVSDDGPDEPKFEH